ncbi:DUF2505 domain-containing protein [Antrihabitans stalactiti]|uniref:DUF2505 domain-containing protein n=1 Tax=Antrihabitans stalactiti TaxID=2584121 RepID=A0A848KFZ8_9NOCA|nr:DUF2505 domain-containing protein [Antrihabitans stalactiti]NMN97913.1 DUF2505 domain-containing protein [Antrihabitans stalactiti]
MSRSFEFDLAYTSTPAQVHAVLTSEEYWRSVFEGAENADVTYTSPGPGALRVVLTQVIGDRSIPGPVRRVLGGELTLSYAMEWQQFDGPGATGSFGGKSTGVVGLADGVFALTDAGTGALITAKGKVEVKVRLVGGVIEKIFEQALHKTLTHQRNDVEKWIAERSSSETKD